MRPIKLLVLTALFAMPLTVFAQSPKTRPERTNYEETSTYQDVRAFLDDLTGLHLSLKQTIIGKSAGGRDIPLVVVCDNPSITPSQAKKSGRPIVYIQANIHGGEVEGKEAVQALMRDLCINQSPLLKKLVLVIAPIYNIDGNEKWGDNRTNRGSQNGPARIGDRPNGDNFDLNRDCVKAETPEMQSVLKHVYITWDPDVVMDLHTTNGTRHGYQLTYSPPLDPVTEGSILTYSRDSLLPIVRAKLAKIEQFTQDYGNVEGRGDARAWRTFGWEPRYVTNYVGMRNRIAILSEAASFLPFKTRIDSTRLFVAALLDQIAIDAKKIITLTRGADSRVVKEGKIGGVELGVRFEMAARGSEKVELEKVAAGQVVDHMTAPTSFETFTFQIFDRFVPTKKAKLPTAYIVPSTESKVVELLQKHGIVVEKLVSDWRGTASRLIIDKRNESSVAFQGHKLVSLDGHYESAEVTAKSGDYVVLTAQPLGRLIFNILEPESQDGAIAWGMISVPIGLAECPILKIIGPAKFVSEKVK